MADPTGLPLVNTDTNQVESVPWDAAHQALTTGTHNLQAGQTINIVNPDGNLVSLPSEQVPDALHSGYSIPSQALISEHANQQKYGEGTANELKAGVAAAARAATMGLSDVGLTHQLSPGLPGSELVQPETLKQLQEKNPASDIAGTVAGIAGSIGLAPELSPVGIAAKAGNAVTDAAAPVASKIAQSLANPETSPIVAKILASTGKVAAKTLGSAVEGSAYGLGQTVSEDALGDANFNGENLLHNVGYNALFAGALGGALGLGEETYKGLKSYFGKEIANAGGKDAIIENAALNPTPQNIAPPTSLEEIAKHIENAGKEGYGPELPAKSRLLETNDILAGDSQYPAHSLQVQSLSSPVLRDGYKTALENPLSEDGQALRTWEAVQKQEGSQKLLPKFIQDIAPEAKLTDDAVEGGNHAIKTFTDQYKSEKQDLAPFFKEFDKQSVNSLDMPHDLLNTIDQAIPESQKYITKGVDGMRAISPYKSTMGFSKDAHSAISNIIEAFNKPEISIGEIRNLRESLRDSINFLSSPRSSGEVSRLRKGLMDVIQDRMEQLSPDLNTREMFKRYAVNEEKRAIIEQMLGGSISDKTTFAKEIKPEDVLNKIFSNTVSVKAAKDILGKDFDHIAANYLKQRVGLATDQVKNGFSSNKFATFLKQKGPELEEALAQHPEQLKKIGAITDKMRILPDSPSINPSGTAKTSLIQKMQSLGGYLGKDGITSIPGKIIGKLGEAYGEMQQHSEFNRILRSNTDMGSEQQLTNKVKQYGAYSKIERMQQATTNAISKGASALFNAAESGKGAVAQKLIPKEKQMENYEKMEAHLKSMTGNSDQFIDALHGSTKDLNAIAPNINSALTIAAVRATQFLQSKLPAQVPSSVSTKPYKPSRTELARFNRYVQAVDNPLHVLKQMKTGNLTSEALETLHTVYPKLTSQMQQAFIEKMTPKNMEKIPYQQKIMLSAFLGEDLANGLKQPNIASAQISVAQPQKPQADTVKPSQKGLGKLTQSNQLLTPAQASNQRAKQ